MPISSTASPMTALVKGAGPSGLSAAISLAQEGFQVTVAEKRPFRSPGSGRKNMVALRPEALHQLDLLGSLSDAQQKGTFTPITAAATYNEWDDSTFTWPLDTQPRYEGPDNYVPPAKIDDQVPSSFINLGHLEDHLTIAAEKLGVEIRYGSTFDLEQAGDGSDRYAARWKDVGLGQDGSSDVCGEGGRDGADSARDNGLRSASPFDIVVCASGKNDLSLAKSLGFQRHVGVKLDDANLPLPPSRELRLGPDHEVESQRYLVVGIRSPAPVGTLAHEVRKKDTGRPEQPVVEIEMRHAAASHYILQIPRGFGEEREGLDRYVTDRVNRRQGASFENVAGMFADGAVVWGDPVAPVQVETSTAPRFVFGSNVVLVGDAGMSCSPTSGLGADIGLTHDGQAVRRLARELRRAREGGRGGEQDGKGDEGEGKEGGLCLSTAWQAALNEFNMSKAKGAVIWSRGSNWFYLSNEKANEILTSVKEAEAAL